MQEKPKYKLDTFSRLHLVSTRSYGLRMMNSSGKLIVFNLIQKHMRLPVSTGETFLTPSDNATSLEFVLYCNNESEKEVALDKSEELGVAEFSLDGNLPAGSPIEIIFNLDEQGKLILTAIDQTHGKQITADFKSDGAMSEEEKQEAIAQSRDIVLD